MEGNKGREVRKEFVFDHSYWSADSRDAHFVTQEKVGIITSYLNILFHSLSCLSHSFAIPYLHSTITSPSQTHLSLAMATALSKESPSNCKLRSRLIT